MEICPIPGDEKTIDWEVLKLIVEKAGEKL
jgi:hypothetical protein